MIALLQSAEAEKWVAVRSSVFDVPSLSAGHDRPQTTDAGGQQLQERRGACGSALRTEGGTAKSGVPKATGEKQVETVTKKFKD